MFFCRHAADLSGTTFCWNQSALTASVLEASKRCRIRQICTSYDREVVANGQLCPFVRDYPIWQQSVCRRSIPASAPACSECREILQRCPCQPTCSKQTCCSTSAMLHASRSSAQCSMPVTRDESGIIS